MADHIRLFSRPLVMDDVEAALSITGALPEYTPGDAFEGRLQINNAIGRCKVELMPDAVLPSGVAVRVDNVTKEIVLKWTAFEIVDPVEDSPVLNGDFEAGDDGNWLNHHRGWSIVNGSGRGGGHAAQFGPIRGINNYVGTLVPVTNASSIIKLQCDINHGSAPTGDLAVGPFLLWYDANRLLVRWTDPNQYVRGGKNGDWHSYSFAEGASGDVNIKYVAPGLTANRKGASNSCWVDNVRWNHRYTLGQDTYDDYFVHVKVTDSLNRVAYWSGYITFQSVWYTSTPYKIMFREGAVHSESDATEFAHWNPTKSGSAEDSSESSGSLIMFIHERGEHLIVESSESTGTLILFVHRDPSTTHQEPAAQSVGTLVMFKHVNESQTVTDSTESTGVLTEFIHA